MDGVSPARVADSVIDEIRSRERNGLVELPKRRLRAGDAVRIWRGPFAGHLALYAGVSSRERVAVLLSLLGAQRRLLLAEKDIEAVR